MKIEDLFENYSHLAAQVNRALSAAPEAAERARDHITQVATDAGFKTSDVVDIFRHFVTNNLSIPSDSREVVDRIHYSHVTDGDERALPVRNLRDSGQWTRYIKNYSNQYGPRAATPFIKFVEHLLRSQTFKNKFKEPKIELVYHGPTMKIVQLHNMAAGCSFGGGTRWCISTKSSGNQFDNYVSQHNKAFGITVPSGERFMLIVDPSDGYVKQFQIEDNSNNDNSQERIFELLTRAGVNEVELIATFKKFFNVQLGTIDENFRSF